MDRKSSVWDVVTPEHLRKFVGGLVRIVQGSSQTFYLGRSRDLEVVGGLLIVNLEWCGLLTDDGRWERWQHSRLSVRVRDFDHARLYEKALVLFAGLYNSLTTFYLPGVGTFDLEKVLKRQSGADALVAHITGLPH